MRRPLSLPMTFAALSSVLVACGGGGAGGGGGGPDAGTAATFVHTSTVANNPVGLRTELDHPSINGRPDARLIVTPTYDPNSVYNVSPLAVGYSAGTGRWSILNDDSSIAVPQSSSYVVSNVPTAFVHIVAAGNLSGTQSVLDHPSLNGVPDAVVFVTHNHTPGGGLSSGDLVMTSPVGLLYDAPTQRWRIFQEDPSDAGSLNDGDAFNVVALAPSPGVPNTVYRHTVNALNHFGDVHVSYHVALGGIPRVHMVHVGTPVGGGALTFNDDVVGIFDHAMTLDMALFNEGGTPLVDGQEFFVWLIP